MPVNASLLQLSKPTIFGGLVGISRKQQFLGRKIGNDFPSKIWVIVLSVHPIAFPLPPSCASPSPDGLVPETQLAVTS